MILIAILWGTGILSVCFVAEENEAQRCYLVLDSV